MIASCRCWIGWTCRTCTGRSPIVLHTSSDGQKFEVAVDSLNANYSFKYLGKDKGVSVVSFIDMRHLLWHSTVISSAEREAAYVIDGLMHNDVVKSDIHSTDTHGYSDIISPPRTCWASRSLPGSRASGASGSTPSRTASDEQQGDMGDAGPVHQPGTRP